MKEFLKKIARFNSMYRLKSSPHPVLPTADDLRKFKSILQEELDELDEIIVRLENFTDRPPYDAPVQYWNILTDLADWHGDMIVYPHTHAHRFGLPMDLVLDAIMESNFSKLGADGQPIYDERGKVIKGPFFSRPEPAIERILIASGGTSV